MIGKQTPQNSNKCEYDERIFDSDHNNLATPRPPEITIRSEQTADEMRTTPGTIPANSPEIIPHTDGSCDGMDVDHDMQPPGDPSVDQLDPTPTNPRSSKYDLRHNPKSNCNEDYRYWLCQTIVYGTHTYTLRKFQKCAMRNTDIFFQALKLAPSQCNYSALPTGKYKFWHLHRLGIGSSSNYSNISSDDIWNVSGTIPEPFRKIHQNLIPDTLWNTCGYA